MFAALMNPKLAQFLDNAWDKGMDWLLLHGISLVMTLAIMMLALKISSVLIDQIGKALQAGLPLSKRARAAQRTGTLTQILSSTVKTVILFAGSLMALSEVGINVTPILASAGVVGLAVGFGAQSLVKDVVSGFFILLEDQYGMGDAVTISGHSGVVVGMNLRITQLRDADGSLITIPNGLVAIVANQSKLERAAAGDGGLEPAVGANS
ncbi:putative MscS family protein YkuT [compost metagenome]